MSEHRLHSSKSQHIEIVGGASTSGTVSICSSDFNATAFCHGNKIYAYAVAIPRVNKFLDRNVWFIPQFVQLASFLVTSLPRRTLIALLASSTGTSLFLYFLLSWLKPHQGAVAHPPPLAYACIGLMAAVAWVVTQRRYIGPWHAAEHMTIAAYGRLKTTELEDARKESRIDPACGGRFLFPLMIDCLLTRLVGKYLGTGAWTFVFLIVAIEITLQLDYRVGLARIPIFKQASELLQRHVTTREPEEIHLRVARAALMALVAKHQQTSKP